MKFENSCNLNLIFDIRKKYISLLIHICNNLHVLYISPFVIDVFDRLLIKINYQIVNNIIDFDNYKINTILISLIILISGIFNQKHPSYSHILSFSDIKSNLKSDIKTDISNINKLLLELLDILDYDILRPFYIFFCPSYFNKINCNCSDKNNIKIVNNCKSFIIHNSDEHKILENVLNHIVNNNLFGLSPDDYFEKLEIFKLL